MLVSRMPAALRRRLPPGVEEALDDLEHNCDLINARPLPCEVRWVLDRLGVSHGLAAQIAGFA
jgi:hypothetical protein